MREAARRKLLTIAHSPELFLRDIDPIRDTAVLSPMSEDSYRASLFLDNRIVRADDRDVGMPIASLAKLLAAQRAPRRTIHWLFHVGHCGSSLLARLLGEVDGLLALREPAVVMGLARSARRLDEPDFPISRERWDTLASIALRLLGRTWREDERAFIKATSHAANLIPQLMRFTGEERALVLYLDLETYLATMLRPETLRELRLYAGDFRLREFRRLAPEQPAAVEDYSPARLAALTWLLNVRELSAPLDDPELAARALAFSFDAYLAEPVRWLGAICEFLERPMTMTSLRNLAHGPLATSHAKSPEHAFDVARRARMLDEERTHHARAIEDAMEWAVGLGRRHQIFDGLIDRFG